MAAKKTNAGKPENTAVVAVYYNNRITPFLTTKAIKENIMLCNYFCIHKNVNHAKEDQKKLQYYIALKIALKI